MDRYYCEAAQLKTIQEIITLVVFCVFSVAYLKGPLASHRKLKRAEQKQTSPQSMKKLLFRIHNNDSFAKAKVSASLTLALAKPHLSGSVPACASHADRPFARSS